MGEQIPRTAINRTFTQFKIERLKTEFEHRTRPQPILLFNGTRMIRIRFFDLNRWLDVLFVRFWDIKTRAPGGTDWLRD